MFAIMMRPKKESAVNPHARVLGRTYVNVVVTCKLFHIVNPAVSI